MKVGDQGAESALGAWWASLANIDAPSRLQQPAVQLNVVDFRIRLAQSGRPSPLATSKETSLTAMGRTPCERHLRATQFVRPALLRRPARGTSEASPWR